MLLTSLARRRSFVPTPDDITPPVRAKRTRFCLCDNGSRPTMAGINLRSRPSRVGLHERLRGDRIEAAWFSKKPEPFKSPPQVMARELAGRRIDRVFSRRQAHRLRFSRFPRVKSLATKALQGQELQWVVHLGMTGRLLVADPDTPVPAQYPRPILHLASGRELRFCRPAALWALGAPRIPKQHLRSSASRAPVRNLSASRRTSSPRSSSPAGHPSRLPC